MVGKIFTKMNGEKVKKSEKRTKGEKVTVDSKNESISQAREQKIKRYAASAEVKRVIPYNKLSHPITSPS